LGRIGVNTKGTPMKIVEFNNPMDITVEFQDEHKYRKKTFMPTFAKGSVKNPYDITVWGHGYRGDGDYLEQVDGIKSVRYNVWEQMLKRCYNFKNPQYQPTYTGEITVCNEWLNFQNFAKWYDENYYEVPNEKMQLDKDILHKGNKIYNPNDCIFVPQTINLIFVRRKNYRNGTPCGVGKQGNHYYATCGHDKIIDNLGSFNTPEEAFQAYKIRKEETVKQTADGYKQYIPQRLYDALYNWKTDITD